MPAYPPPAALPERLRLATTAGCSAPRRDGDGRALGTGKASALVSRARSAVTVATATPVPAGAR